MINKYSKFVRETAKDFLTDHEDMIVEALADEFEFDQNTIHGLDRAWNESIMDQGFSSEDTHWIMSNTDNEETDDGLWEGLDFEEQLVVKASYSFSADVFAVAKEIYSQMLEDVDDQFNELTTNYDEMVLEREEDEDDTGPVLVEPKREDVAKNVFIETLYEDADAVLCDISSLEAFELMKKWMELGDQSSRSRYPIGSAYIDARCGHMFGTVEYDYVEADGVLVKKIPRLANLGKNEAIKIMAEANPFFKDWNKKQKFLEEVQRASCGSFDDMIEKVKSIIELSTPHPDSD